MRAVTLAITLCWIGGIWSASVRGQHAIEAGPKATGPGFVDPEPSTGWLYGTLIVTSPTKIHFNTGDIVIPARTHLRMVAGSANKVAVHYNSKVFTVPIVFTSDAKRQRYLSEMRITPDHPVSWVGFDVLRK